MPYSDATYTNKTKYVETIQNIIEEIINKSTTDGSPLMKYIFALLPIKMVKNSLSIYEGPNDGEDDVDRKNTMESLFLHINKILELSTTTGLNKSLLTENLKDYVFPFYIEYSTLFIKEMKKLIDGYLRHIQGHNNILEILNELSTR